MWSEVQSIQVSRNCDWHSSLRIHMVGNVKGRMRVHCLTVNSVTAKWVYPRGNLLTCLPFLPLPSPPLALSPPLSLPPFPLPPCPSLSLLPLSSPSLPTFISSFPFLSFPYYNRQSLAHETKQIPFHWALFALFMTVFIHSSAIKQ